MNLWFETVRAKDVGKLVDDLPVVGPALVPMIVMLPQPQKVHMPALHVGQP